MSQHPTDPPANSPEPRPWQPNPAQQLPSYQLILHAGGVHDMMFVVRTIMELTRLCQAEATHKMWEAHHYGRSLLLVTYRERAELYVEQFSERGLKVTMERVN